MAEKDTRLRTLLTEEQIQKLKKKVYRDWRDTDNPYLTGPITPEGREKALRNLRPYAPTKKKDSMFLPEVEEEQQPELEFPDGETEKVLSSYMSLNADEKKYYIRRWREYKRDFDIQTAADEALLRDVIMEEILMNRLRTLTLQNEKTDLSEQMKKCMDRRKDAFSKLSTIRKQKWQRLDEETSLAKLIQEWDKRKLLYEEELPKKEEEERVLMEKNKKQFEADIVEYREGYTDMTEQVKYKPPKVEKKDDENGSGDKIWKSIALA